MQDCEKYIEAWEYLNRSLHTALACLDVKDEKAVNSLMLLRELVKEYQTREERKIVLEAMERNSDDGV